MRENPSTREEKTKTQDEPRKDNINTRLKETNKDNTKKTNKDNTKKTNKDNTKKTNKDNTKKTRQDKTLHEYPFALLGSSSMHERASFNA